MERARGLRPTTKLAAEFRASTDFHHADIRISWRICLHLRSLTDAFFSWEVHIEFAFFRRLPSGMLTWEPCSRRPLLNWRKYKARTKIKTIAVASTQNLCASKKTPLYGFTCTCLLVEVFISLEIFLRVPQKNLRASRNSNSSLETRYSIPEIIEIRVSIRDCQITYDRYCAKKI